MAVAIPHPPAPRYRPGSAGTRARRIFAALGALGLTALVSAAWLHSNSFMLRCEDGTLRAYRSGLVPWEQVPLEDPALPPLNVAPHLCRDVVVDSPQALVTAYASIVTRDVDRVLETEDQGALGVAERALDTLAALQATEDPQVMARRRALLVAQLRADLAAARAARLRALERLRRARELGVKPALLAAFERELAELDEDPSPRSPRHAPTDPGPNESPEPPAGTEGDPAPGRSL